MYDNKIYPPYTPSAPQTPAFIPPVKPRIAWGGVLAMAFVVPIVYVALNIGLYLAILKVGFGVLVLGPFFVVLYFVPIAITLWLAVWWLKKLGIRHPFIIPVASTAVSYGIYTITTRLVQYYDFSANSYANIFSSAFYISILALMFVTYIAFVLTVVVFVLYSMRSNKNNLQVPVMIIVAAVVVAGAFLIPKPTFEDIKAKRVENLRESAAWMYLPTHEIKGVSGMDRCHNVSLEYPAFCSLTLDSFPGYLKDTTAVTVMKTVESDSSIIKNYQLFDVTIGRDNEKLEPYKIKDEKCDLPSLRGVLDIDYSYDKKTNPDPKRCVSVTTTGGTKLYYESYLNYGEDAAPVPNIFYFEKGETVVVIEFSVYGYFKKDQLNSYIAGSEETRDELYKFVDSFKPYNEVKK